jgi:multidrug efflux system membrane fusion protein
VVTQLQPITVLFTLPEDDIPPILKQMQAGATLPVTAWDRTNTQQVAAGTLQSIDSQIDTTTGTIRLKAIFPNTDQVLFPQQFVNVVLLLDTLHDATLVPQSGVQRGAPGTYVYVVNADQTVSVRKVSLGPGDATNISITQGLAPGETIVVDGADKLKDGAKILVRQGNQGASGGGGGASGAAAGQTPHTGQHPHAGQGQGGRGRQQQNNQSGQGGG